MWFREFSEVVKDCKPQHGERSVAVCSAHHRFCFSVHPFDGGVAHRRFETRQDSVLMFSHRPGKVSHLFNPRMSRPPDNIVERKIFRHSLKSINERHAEAALAHTPGNLLHLDPTGGAIHPARRIDDEHLYAQIFT